MSTYMIQGSYTPIAWSSMLRAPENRAEAVSTIVERLGGRLLQSWLCFGEHDIVAIVEVPNTHSAAALFMAIAAGGVVVNIRTTELIDDDQGLLAMQRASQVQLRPPAGSLLYQPAE